MSFDHVMATAFAWTITLLYLYLCIWELDLRLNNINYSYWYYSSSIIITSLYWTSETLFSPSITTSKYLICDKCLHIVICKSTCLETTSPWWSYLQNIQAHLSHNTSYGGAATIWVFCLPWRRYSYSTWSSMTELFLSVSQYWNLCLG